MTIKTIRDIESQEEEIFLVEDELAEDVDKIKKDLSMLKKSYYFLLALVLALIVILLLSYMASASAISVSPSSFSFSAYPGEIIEKNITILTSGNYAVYLSSSNSSIILNYSSPLIVEGTKILPIQFVIPKNISINNFSIKINAETDIIENTITIEKEGKAKTKIIYRTKNTTLEKIVYINDSSNQNLSLPNVSPNKKFILSNVFQIVTGILLIIAVLGIIILYQRSKQNNEKLKGGAEDGY